MICYKDKTFCDYWVNCADGGTCHRALTEEISRGAQAAKLPICEYAGRPECFKPITIEKGNEIA